MGTNESGEVEVPHASDVLISASTHPRRRRMSKSLWAEARRSRKSGGRRFGRRRIGRLERFADIGERANDETKFVDAGSEIGSRQRDSTLRHIVDVRDGGFDVTSRQREAADGRVVLGYDVKHCIHFTPA